MLQITADVSHDAVIVLPGVMGSELVDTATGRVLWGLADPSWYVSAWTSGSSLEALEVTEAEREGIVGRIRPTRLLRVPAFAPVLRGVEPYTDLVAGVRRTVAHPDAVLEFPYDWRLPVAHNAQRLARAAERHLALWRAHAEGSRAARLVLVAHSMGGLVARYFTGVLGDGGMVRATVTLGTPFRGAVKAAYILSTGRGSPLPLPRRRLRRLALTLPAIYDLLPAYRCVDEGQSARWFTPADVAGIGGDPDLARQSAALHERLAGLDGGNLRAMVGVGMPTMQSLVLADGVVHARQCTCEDNNGGLVRVDRRGDATVYRDAAAPSAVDPAYLPQSHSALAKSPEAIAYVQAVVTDTRLGPPLGVSTVGVDVPDVVAVHEPFDIVVDTVEDPAAATSRIAEAGTGRQVARPQFAYRDGHLAAQATLPRPGLYRVEVKSGGFSAVTQLVLAVPAADLVLKDTHDG